jgi:hypothetical protein
LILLSIIDTNVKVPQPPGISGCPGIRAIAATCLLVGALLGTSAHAAIDPKLVKAATDPSTKVRLVAVAGLARAKDKDAARPVLEGLVRDPEATVRTAAVDALGKLGDPASLAVVRVALQDGDAGVQKVASRVEKALEAKVIWVDIGDVADLTDLKLPKLLDALQQGVEDALRQEGLPSAYVVRRGGVERGYGLQLRLRKLQQRMDGGNGVVEVTCDLTLVELPRKALRQSSTAQAAAAVEGPVPPRLVGELALDGIAACAPALARDFADFVRKHGGPRGQKS